MKLISSTYELMDVPTINDTDMRDITRLPGLISVSRPNMFDLHITVSTTSVLEDVCEILGLDCNGGKGE